MERGMMRNHFASKMLATMALIGSVTLALDAMDGFAPVFRARAPEELVLALPPLPPPSEFAVQLVLDDDMAEGDFGVGSGGQARQFLWFNRFTTSDPFTLEQVWVLFAPGPNITVGAPIELAIYHDTDGDPTNGADLLATFQRTILVADGVTFSIYDLAPAVSIPESGDVLIGVVNRFVESGVTSPTFPATVDTTASQQRSWFAVWSGDPPEPPELPSDSVMLLVDNALPGLAGNWMIRGFGSSAPVLAIPVLGTPGLLILTVLLAGGALWNVHRRKTAAGPDLER
jgi:hypothetical protein